MRHINLLNLGEVEMARSLVDPQMSADDRPCFDLEKLPHQVATGIEDGSIEVSLGLSGSFGLYINLGLKQS